MIAHRSRHGAATFAFTDRFGGVSTSPFAEANLARHVGDAPEAVEENRRRLADALGPAVGRIAFMNQVHGADVGVVDGWGKVHVTGSPRAGEDRGGADAATPPVDALVTTEPGVALAVLVADCVPVLLADPAAGVVAVAHAGRPGLAAGVVPAVVDVMREAGAGEIVAQLGPAVCGACYEVPEQMRAEVASVVPESWSTTRDGTPALDVPGGVRAQLGAQGVRVDPLARSVCTIEDPAYFSYRRERTTGRFAGVAWLQP